MKTVISPVGRVFSQKMAEFNGVRGFMYGETTGSTATGHSYMCFYKGTRITRRALLPDGTNNLEYPEIALMPDALVLSSYSTAHATYAQTDITEYPLTDPLATGSLTGSLVHRFGDSNSRRSELVPLSDGRLLCAVVQHELQAVDFALRTGPGQWINLGRFFVFGNYPKSHEFCAVQAPDGAIWAYIIIDGGWVINAMRLQLNGDVMTLDGAFPRWINNDSTNGVYVYGRTVVNGEIPSIRAVKDVVNKRQLLAYPSREGVLVNEVNKAYPVLTAVALDGTPSFVTMSTRLMPPNSNPVGLALPGVMTYIQTDLETGDQTKLVQIDMSGSVTELADVLPTTLAMAWSTDTPDVAYVDATGAVTLSSSGVEPVPALVPLLFTKRGKEITFTWAGTAVVQKSVTAAGPWKPVATQSPYKFQAANAANLDQFTVRTQSPVAYFRALAV